MRLEPIIGSSLARVREHLPLIVLGAGALAVFVANVLARRVFSSSVFVCWAYLSSLTTFFFSFALLGSEQLIIRSARESGGKLRIPRKAARWILRSMVLFVICYWTMLDGRIFAYRLGVIGAPILICIAAIQVVHQLERARGSLLVSQLSLNIWKFALPGMIFFVPAMTPWRAEIVTIGALLIGFIYVAAVFRRGSTAFEFTDDATDAGVLFFPFMLSLGMMGVLNVADRIVLEKVQQPDAFAGYVYLTTILTTPFGILATYFGFKEAVRYRHVYSTSGVHRDVLRAMSVASGLVATWSYVCYATRTLTGLPFDGALWVLLGMLSVLRCGYGVLSAALGIRGTAPAIIGANVVTGLALVLFGYLATTIRISVYVIVGSYVLVWFARALAYLCVLDGGRHAD